MGAYFVGAVVDCAAVDAHNTVEMMKSFRNFHSFQDLVHTFRNIRFRCADGDSLHRNNALETLGQNMSCLQHRCQPQTRLDSTDYGDFERRFHCSKFDSGGIQPASREQHY